MSASAWLNRFATRCARGHASDVAGLFADASYWRDYLPFGWTLQTVEGAEAIGRFGARHGPTTGFSSVVFEGGDADREGFFRFRTTAGTGRGYLRLDGADGAAGAADAAGADDARCHTLFTMLEDLAETRAARARDAEPDAAPFVLVVGGGQSGLALGAQLADLGVPYRIVDGFPRVGDQWRRRYDSLVLHDPVWYDHLPFKPFPDDWPVFTPKDRMADWLEDYAAERGLDVRTGTELIAARHDPAEGRWSARLRHDGEESDLHASHLVLALGLSGFPNMPSFPGQDDFRGPRLHSSAYGNGAELAGRDVVVVGANNSAHDIAADLVRRGARPTLVQRSSSLVVRQQDYCDKVLGPLYSAEAVNRGITTERADILQASVPLRLLESRHRVLWDGIRRDQADYYAKLEDAGFSLDFAEDGTGLGMKYRRTASGYYIDVGAAEMVMDGRIAVRSGHGISRLSAHRVHLDDGSALPADALICATGYGNMTDWVAALIDRETADRVGPCWGYGSNTRGDPGPWIGELRNMWLPTAQRGLWFAGGNLSQARFFSRLLALQLAGRFRDEQA